MNNSMVAHLWANEKEESARGSNLFFEGRSIYSYGYHFEVGRIVRNKCGEKAYLLNDKYYSSSTCKHQHCVRSAIPTGSKVFSVGYNMSDDGSMAFITSRLELIKEVIEKYKKELYNNSMLIKIDKQIDHIEEQKRRLKVRELSFNSYYEFALERIPQIVAQEKIQFHIRDFAAILKQFYRGGELEMTLNSDLDVNLFNEQFIVFEIDKIKDDPVLFPIVVLIIMDVFLQKMRIKKGRKALIIEEAWKAIASPTMAEYIKYLYKTVRKFHGIAGVVTQELNDVIDSPIVKEAIINNSDVKILLDQTKFKDRYEDIAAILGLTPIQRQQIFTINALNNREGRSYFKEVWICRGQNSDVYGVEEAPECYWAYTTERTEKEALKLYLTHYGTMQKAITRMEADRHQAGSPKYLEFARQVNEHQKVMSLW